MQFGIPQQGRDSRTKRVLKMQWWSTSAGDEIFLTSLCNALEAGGISKMFFIDSKGDVCTISFPLEEESEL